MKSSIIKGTLILTIAGLLTRFIGFFYRIYLAKILGTTELGLYQLILPVYGICFTLYGSGLQTATSQLISKHKKERHAAVLRGALCLSLGTALCLSILVIAYSDWLARNYLHEATASPLLKIMALLFPFCGVSAMLNGYFYGLKKSKVPATAQILEQVSRVSFVFLFTLIPFLPISFTEVAVFGIVMGEIAGCLYNLVKINRYLPVKSILKRDTILKPLLKFSIPLTGSRISVAFLSSMEATLIPISLYQYGYSKSDALSFFGILSGMVMPFILFPGTLTNSLGVLLLPSIANAKQNKSQNALIHQSKLSVHYSLLLGLLAAAFFMNFGDVLGEFFFNNAQAGKMLSILAVICPFIYASSTTQTIINGLGKTTVTLRIHLISLAIRILSLFVLTPRLGIVGYLGGIMCSEVVLFSLSCMYLRKKIPSFYRAGYLIWGDMIFFACVMYITKTAGNFLVSHTSFLPAVFIPLFPAGVVLYIFMYLTKQIESPKALLRK